MKDKTLSRYEMLKINNDDDINNSDDCHSENVLSDQNGKSLNRCN